MKGAESPESISKNPPPKVISSGTNRCRLNQYRHSSTGMRTMLSHVIGTSGMLSMKARPGLVARVEVSPAEEALPTAETGAAYHEYGSSRNHDTSDIAVAAAKAISLSAPDWNH
jgi:hypothetical protein